MLSAGIVGIGNMVVQECDTARAVGSGSLDVLATPVVLRLVESVASGSVAHFLDEGSSTVGTRADLSHSAPSPVGSKVVCRTRLTEVDRRRLVFSFTVSDNSGVVASGTHERFVVDDAKFMSKAASRIV